jgi:hypothetical protein
MRKLMLVAALCVAGYYYYEHHRQARIFAAEPEVLAETYAPVELNRPQPAMTQAFRCEGKTMCHQMSSCEEATFYLRNCPGTKMDGDHDGIPCERSLCN